MRRGCEKNGSNLESMKAYNIKITDDINTLKKDVGKQFVKVTEQIADVRGIVANTKSDKFVDDKFSFEEDDTMKNTWVKVVGKHVDTKLGQVASEVQTMQKARITQKIQMRSFTH